MADGYVPDLKKQNTEPKQLAFISGDTFTHQFSTSVTSDKDLYIRFLFLTRLGPRNFFNHGLKAAINIRIVHSV